MTASPPVGVSPAASIPPAALWLGGTGLIPFVVPVVALWLGSPTWREPAWAVLHGYAAIILSKCKLITHRNFQRNHFGFLGTGCIIPMSY